MIRFILGVIVGVSVSAGVVSSQYWASFRGTVYEKAAEKERDQQELELQKLRQELTPRRDFDPTAWTHKGPC